MPHPHSHDLQKRRSASYGGPSTKFLSSLDKTKSDNNNTLNSPSALLFHLQQHKTSDTYTSRILATLLAPYFFLFNLFYKCLLASLVVVGFVGGCAFYVVCLFTVAIFSFSSLGLSVLACWKLDASICLAARVLDQKSDSLLDPTRRPSTCSTTASSNMSTPVIRRCHTISSSSESLFTLGSSPSTSSIASSSPGCRFSNQFRYQDLPFTLPPMSPLKSLRQIATAHGETPLFIDTDDSSPQKLYYCKSTPYFFPSTTTNDKTHDYNCSVLN